jgi:hypothetical protein
LLSYIVHPFFIPEDDPRYFNHTNIWFARAIVQVLNQLGYSVDVIHYRDQGELPRQDYYLFIGHGGENFERICQQLRPATRKILFTTTSYWQFNNHQEQARFADLEQRRGARLPYDRRIQHSEDAALRLADGVIGLGNPVTLRTYAGFDHVVMLNGAALYDDTWTGARRSSMPAGRISLFSVRQCAQRSRSAVGSLRKSAAAPVD